MTDSDSKDFSRRTTWRGCRSLNTLSKVGNDLPNKSTAPTLGSQNGTTQTYLISAFKGFGLIHEDGTVDPSFKAFANDKDKIKEAIAAAPGVLPDHR